MNWVFLRVCLVCVVLVLGFKSKKIVQELILKELRIRKKYPKSHSVEQWSGHAKVNLHLELKHSNTK